MTDANGAASEPTPVGDTQQEALKRDDAGFYHDPPLWVGSSPVDHASQSANFPAFRETVFDKALSNRIALKVTREGLFAFTFSSWEPGRLLPDSPGAPMDFEKQASAILNRTLVMNAFLAFFYTNEHRLSQFERDRMVVTPELVISMHGDGMGFGTQRVSQLVLSSYESTYRPQVPAIFDDRIMFRGKPVPLEVVAKTADELDQLLASDTSDGLLLADLFLRSSKSYQDQNHSFALIINWTITEKLIQELWQVYQRDNKDRDGRRFITKERAKRLDDGRTFTAAVITEMLSFAQYISAELYADICIVRKKRNDWIHSLVSGISSDDARKAADVSSRLLQQVRGIELEGRRGL